MIATKKKIALLMVVAIMATAGMVMATNLTGAYASEADGEPVSYTPGSSEITLEDLPEPRAYARTIAPTK